MPSCHRKPMLSLHISTFQADTPLNWLNPDIRFPKKKLWQREWERNKCDADTFIESPRRACLYQSWILGRHCTEGLMGNEEKVSRWFVTRSWHVSWFNIAATSVWIPRYDIHVISNNRRVFFSIANNPNGFVVLQGFPPSPHAKQKHNQNENRKNSLSLLMFFWCTKKRECYKNEIGTTKTSM